MPLPEDFIVRTVGPAHIPSPTGLSVVNGDSSGNYVPDEARVRYQAEYYPGQEKLAGLLFEKSGPREQIYFNPAKTKAAIVTCGGLCPGLNNVIRSIVLELYHNYGVKEILGIRYGYQGLNPAKGKPTIDLSSSFVKDIHTEGGTVLGVSRGPESPHTIVDFLDYNEVDILFCIGGEGTLKGAHAIFEELKRDNKNISIVGIPKTIDNDIKYAWKSFGFSTAVDKAKEIIDCGHMEARGAPNGIGLVKVMGREADFIASAATLASQEVNFTLIPEIAFELEGNKGFLYALKKRILARGHAVIVVAEGAGQDLILSDPSGKDASGNKKLNDIGVFLRDKIIRYFKVNDIPINIQYIDPSYIIRSVPANGDDRLFCNSLARHAVHAAMAGKTDMLVGFWHNAFVNVPIPAAVKYKKQVSPESGLWQGVLESTGQPKQFINR